METKIELKKAKLSGEKHLHVEYSEITTTEDDSFYTEIIKKGGQPVHPDLAKAFDRLIPHLVFLCEYKEELIAHGRSWDPEDEDNIYNFGLFNGFKVTSFTIGGDGEHEGIVITGRKNLSNKKVVNLNTPFTKFSDEHSPYTYENEMYVAFIDACHEVELYLGGKFAPSTQLEMFPDLKVEASVDGENWTPVKNLPQL